MILVSVVPDDSKVLLMAYTFLLPGEGFLFKRYTAPSVTVAPVSSTGVSTSPSTKNPVMAANSGVRNVRLDSAVRLPLEALKKKTPYDAADPKREMYKSSRASWPATSHMSLNTG